MLNDCIKIQSIWVISRHENLEIQEGACTFAPQTLEMIERLSAEQIQQKQGFRENDSIPDRVSENNNQQMSGIS